MWKRFPPNAKIRFRVSDRFRLRLPSLSHFVRVKNEKRESSGECECCVTLHFTENSNTFFFSAGNRDSLNFSRIDFSGWKNRFSRRKKIFREEKKIEKKKANWSYFAPLADGKLKWIIKFNCFYVWVESVKDEGWVLIVYWEVAVLCLVEKSKNMRTLYLIERRYEQPEIERFFSRGS